jgi:hypothetical protein
MKTNRLITPLIIVMFVSFAACKKNDPSPTETERVTKLLTGNWGLASSSGVTVDGLDVTQDLFPNFSITFSENTLATTGTTPVWLRQDTWHFKDESATVIIRGQDNKEITLENISEHELVLTLTWDQTTYDGGRSRSVAGTYRFSLTK